MKIQTRENMTAFSDFGEKHMNGIVVYHLSNFLSFHLLEGTYDIQYLTATEKCFIVSKNETVIQLQSNEMAWILNKFYTNKVT